MSHRILGLLVVGLTLLFSPAAGALTVTSGEPSGAWHDYLTVTITGADLKLKPGTVGSYEGTATSDTITISGEMSIARPQGYVTFARMSASIGDARWQWPSAGDDNRVEGRTVSQSFSLTFKVGSSLIYTDWVSAGASLQFCGGTCAGPSFDFTISLKKPPSVPVVRAYPTVKRILKPATYARLPLSVRDASGKAKVHGRLYQGGTAVRGLKTGFVKADGRKYDWRARLDSDLTGPLFFCVWAVNPAGRTSVNAPRSSCAWLSLLADIDLVSNGCGGEGWDVIVGIENMLGNTSSYHDPGTGETYEVDFRDACDLHDAGYAGVRVRDKINGGIPDFRKYSREEVDVKFLQDMQLLCLKQIPPQAVLARRECWSGITRFATVRAIGYKFFDADLTKPGLQATGPRDNS